MERFFRKAAGGILITVGASWLLNAQTYHEIGVAASDEHRTTQDANRSDSGPKPWEKGTLAKETMQESGGMPLFLKFKNHMYFSKEASKGGGGVAGGGCGCN